MCNSKKDNLISDSLTVEHINAQSLISSLDEVKLLVIGRNIDVLCVSETWLQTNTPDSYVEIPNCTIFRCDKGRGAGVCKYVHSNLNASITDTDVSKPTGVEDVWVKVQYKKWPGIVMGCVYRHPKTLATSFDYIQDVSRMVCLRDKSFYSWRV